jgi:hypothetical protein
MDQDPLAAEVLLVQVLQDGGRPDLVVAGYEQKNIKEIVRNKV